MKGLPDNRTIGPTVIWATPSLPYAPRMDLDPGSRWPLSAQLAQRLRSEIRSGRLVVAALLPSEHELADEYGVSRETARRSLTMLADEGLITRRRGVGSIVAEAEPFEEVRPAPGARISARLAGARGPPGPLSPADRIGFVTPAPGAPAPPPPAQPAAPRRRLSGSLFPTRA